MGNLTNVWYGNTGGGVMCFSALYKGKYWVFGATDGTPQAFSVDPMHSDDYDDHVIEDATDFPTWREVIEAIRESGEYAPYSMEWVEADILHFQAPDKSVNIE